MKIPSNKVIMLIVAMTLLIYQEFSYADQDPTFDQYSYTAAIAENLPVGVEVLRVSATDPDGDSLSYELTWSGHGAFTIEADGDEAVIKTVIALDYEALTNYTLKVGVMDRGIFSTDEVYVYISVINDSSDDGTAPNAPVFDEGETATRMIPYKTPAGVNIGPPITATDLDGDLLKYDISSSSDLNLFQLLRIVQFFSVDEHTGQLFTAKELDDAYDFSFYEIPLVVSDRKGGVDYITVTVNITVVDDESPNTAPTFSANSTTRAVEENSVMDTLIGEPVSATDADEDALIYALSGTHASSFSIDSYTGQLKTKAPLDYETQTSYQVKVTALDSRGGSDVINVTINVTDEIESLPTSNQAPVFTQQAATFSVEENAEAGTAVGTPLSATDGNGDTLVYTVGGTDASWFRVDNYTGQLQIGIPLDYETQTSYEVTVTTWDVDTNWNLKGGSDTINATINAIDDPSEDETGVHTSVNRSPVFNEGETATRSVTENLPVGTIFDSPLTAMDPDGDTLTYDTDFRATAGYDSLYFNIHSNTGQLRIRSLLDYETQDQFTVIYRVRDGRGGGDLITVTINVTDSTTSVFPLEETTRVVTANSPVGRNVGPPVSAINEEGGTLTYTLGGADADLFTIDSETGRLRTGADLDYTRNSYEVTVTVTDENAGSDSIAVTIKINRPPVINRSINTEISVSENLGNYTRIVKISATDPDGDSLSYWIGNDDGFFRMGTFTNTRWVLTTDKVLDYDTQNRHDITVKVSDGRGGTDSIALTLNVFENGPPEFPSETYTRVVPRNSPPGTPVGDPFSAMDPDNDTVTYSIYNSTPFTINRSTGQLRTADDLDYILRTYTVIISATDPHKATNRTNVTVHIDEEIISDNTPPEFSSETTTRTVSKNATPDTPIGDPVSATDEDEDTLVYIVGGADGDAFAIDNTTGQLRTDAETDLAESSYEVTVIVSDGNEGSASITVTINVESGLEIPDVNLETALRTALSLDPHAPIFLENMQQLTTFRASNRSISSLTGLQTATNLTSLDLDDNEIEDVSPLAGLTNLQRLELRNNDVRDVSPLNGLTNLRYIYLRGNENLENLEWLSTLENLQSDIRLPKIVSIPDTGLDTAIRTALETDGNTVLGDLPISEELLENLETLNASNSGISDLTGCEHMTSLTSLDLRNNQITDVSPLSRLYSLETLMLDGNTILDTSVLRELERRGTNIDITIYRYPSWDVNQDGDVDEADVFLVTLTITGESPDVNADGNVNSDDQTAADANKDGSVDTNDILLVFEKFDRPVNLASPVLIAGNAGLDWEILEHIDVGLLRTQLQILRVENDGSLRYKQAIAFLRSLLLVLQPNQTLLLANYPNPFNPETWIPYQLARSGNVSITIYDARGAVVRRLELSYRAEGYYRIRSRAAHWDGRNDIGERVASGIYFYQLEMVDVSLLRKMVILK